MPKIPVAIVLNTFCIGGAELLVSQFIEFEAGNNKFDYYVVELWPSNSIESQKLRTRFSRFSKVISFNIKARPIKSLFEFIIFLKSNHIQVIHAHFTAASIISLVGKVFNPSAKLVITEHSMTNLSWTLNLKSLLYAISLTFSNVVIAVSEESKEYILSQAAWKRRSVKLVLNAINLTPFLEVLEKRKVQSLVKNEKIRLCLISRLVPEKNISYAIDVCNLIFDSGNSVELTIIGDGPSRYSLEEYALSAAKFDIRFIGFSSSIAQYLLESDGLLSMSVDESFSW